MPVPLARFQPASDQSLLVYFGDRITLDAHRQIVRLLRLLESQPIEGIRNLHPAYCSLLIKFDGLRMRHEALEAQLRVYLDRLDCVAVPEPRQVEIPVCYGGAYGPDIEEVCALRGITLSQAIELHASTNYVVYFIGFVPGFAYLGELPDALVTPRLPVPRRSVPRGSVGIAGSQTGIYPFCTPGGWRLIGRTPMLVFQANRSELSVLHVGDHVQFSPISPEQFVAMEEAQRS